jgi:hypothetical protein
MATKFTLVQDRFVKICPKCGKKAGVVNMRLTWFAHSLEEQDLHNTVVLTEHQCKNCTISFWI